MVSIEYSNAYSEVLEILKYVSKNDYEKIPESKIELFEENANKEYNFIYNPDLTLDEQNVSKRAKAIIAILFRDYWATTSQKEKIKAKQNYDRILIEKEKQEKYKNNSLFSDKNMENKKTEEKSVIKVKEEKWYKKLILFFKNIVKK